MRLDWVKQEDEWLEKLSEKNQQIMKLQTRLRELAASSHLDSMASEVGAGMEERPFAKAKATSAYAAHLDPSMDQLIRKSKRQLAIKVIELREKIRRDRVTFFYNLGLAYTYAGLFKDAERSFQKVLELEPNDADAYYNLGILYEEHLHKTDLGIQYYQRFLALSKDQEKSRKVRNWVRMAGLKYGSGAKHVMSRLSKPLNDCLLRLRYNLRYNKPCIWDI